MEQFDESIKETKKFIYEKTYKSSNTTSEEPI